MRLHQPMQVLLVIYSNGGVGTTVTNCVLPQLLEYRLTTTLAVLEQEMQTTLRHHQHGGIPISLPTPGVLQHQQLLPQPTDVIRVVL